MLERDSFTSSYASPFTHLVFSILQAYASMMVSLVTAGGSAGLLFEVLVLDHSIILLVLFFWLTVMKECKQ
jgi:hypothetical protein